MRFKKPTSNVPEVDMTPMIDIVFQLIAFFMVITNFEQAKADERVKLPREVGYGGPPKSKPEKELVVNIGFLRDKEGEKTDPAAYVFDASTGDHLTPEAYAPRLRIEAQLYRDEPGVELKDVLVSIRADGEVPHGDVLRVVKYAQDAEFETIAYSYTQETPQ